MATYFVVGVALYRTVFFVFLFYSVKICTREMSIVADSVNPNVFDLHAALGSLLAKAIARLRKSGKRATAAILPMGEILFGGPVFCNWIAILIL